MKSMGLMRQEYAEAVEEYSQSQEKIDLDRYADEFKAQLAKKAAFVAKMKAGREKAKMIATAWDEALDMDWEFNAKRKPAKRPCGFCGKVH